MKLCIDCEFFKPTERGPECKAFPPWQNPIDGDERYPSCWDQRLGTDPENCGHDAQWFKAKPPVPFE